MSEINIEDNGSVGGSVTLVQPLAPSPGDANAPAPPAPPHPHQIPAPPGDFTGRAQELAKLLENFEQGGALSAVCGPGGVGKTALALKAAQALAGRFPDAQLYVDLRGSSDAPLTPGQAMVQVIRACRPTEKLPAAEAELRALYHSVLEGQRALLLLDDAAAPEQVEPLAPPESCGVLITSRQSFAPSDLHTLPLEPLPPDEALALLISIVGAPVGATGRSPLREIATLCGYLPLALRAAGSLLAEAPDLSPADYARELRDEQTRLKLTGLKAEGVEISVEASFTLSYDRLPPETQAAFAALAIFSADFDAVAEEAVCADPGHRHLSDLVKRSLVSFVPAPSPGGANAPTPLDPASGRYHLHDLARAYAAGRLSPEARAEAAQRHAIHYARVIKTADDLCVQGRDAMQQGLALFDVEWPNIRAGQAWAAAEVAAQTLKVSKTFRVSDDAAQTLKASKTFRVSDDAARACNDYAWQGQILSLRLFPIEQIDWLEAGVAAARRLKDRQAECAHLGNLGLALAQAGEMRKAVERYEQALAVSRDGRYRQYEGQALSNLGAAFANLQEFRRAIDCFEQALALARELGDRPGEGQALGNLGLAHRVLGETRTALGYDEQRLIIARELGDGPGQAQALGNLGLAYYALGELRRAIEYCEQYLPIAREMGDRPGEAQVLGVLGVAHADLDETRQAIEYYEQALAVDREIGDRQGAGTDFGNLGNAYAELGETRKAVQCYEQALVIAHETGDQPGEATALRNVSLALDELGERARAVGLAEAALTIYEQLGDPDAEAVRQQLEEWEAETDR